jgi:hypothetical protein
MRIPIRRSSQIRICIQVGVYRILELTLKATPFVDTRPDALSNSAL